MPMWGCELEHPPKVPNSEGVEFQNPNCPQKITTNIPDQIDFRFLQIFLRTIKPIIGEEIHAFRPKSAELNH